MAEPLEKPDDRYNLPTTALRLALRGNKNIQFTSAQDMRTRGAELTYQKLTESSRPMFIVMNEIDPTRPTLDEPARATSVFTADVDGSHRESH